MIIITSMIIINDNNYIDIIINENNYIENIKENIK